MPLINSIAYVHSEIVLLFLHLRPSRLVEGVGFQDADRNVVGATLTFPRMSAFSFILRYVAVGTVSAETFNSG